MVGLVSYPRETEYRNTTSNGECSNGNTAVMTNLISATHDHILFLVDSYTLQNSSFLSPYAPPPIPNPPLPPLHNRNLPIQNTQQTRTPSRPASPRFVSATALEPERKPSSGSPGYPDPPPDPSSTIMVALCTSPGALERTNVRRVESRLRV
ncbi:hypothetical protein SLE2022_109610 [Rubroshorea leprosula]